MIDKKSRYERTATITVTDPNRPEQAALLELRAIPRTSGFLHVVARAGERLDHLAQRYYRDPTKFWRIADASDHLDPADIAVPAATIVIPPER